VDGIVDGTLTLIDGIATDRPYLSRSTTATAWA